MKEDVKGASVVVAIIAMIIGGLVGFAFGINDDGSTTTLITEGKTQIDSPAPRLQQELTLSLNEYYNYLFQLLSTNYNEGESQRSALLIAEIDDISEEHAQLIADTFAINEEAYLTQLRDVNGLYVDYVNEIKKDETGNTSGIENDISANIDNRVALFAESATNLSPEDLSNELESLNQLLLDYVNEYKTTDYEVALAEQRDSYGKIKSLANRLTRAAVAESPESYTIENEDNTKEQ